MAVEQLTRAMFLDRVYDFEHDSGQWCYRGDVPCVIDFYASWCMPCRVLMPLVEQLAEEYDGRVKFYKVNIEHEPELTSRFGVRGVPTLLFVPMCGAPTFSTGVISRAALQSKIEEQLLKVKCY